MDIEHAEWDILAAVPTRMLTCCRQFIVELHGLDHCRDDEWFARARFVLRKLNEVFAVVHVHGNNFGTHHDVDGVPFLRPWKSATPLRLTISLQRATSRSRRRWTIPTIPIDRR